MNTGWRDSKRFLEQLNIYVSCVCKICNKLNAQNGENDLPEM